MNVLSMLVLKAQMILNREEGQDLIEYALLVGFISLAAVAAIQVISGDLVTLYNQVATAVGTA